MKVIILEDEKPAADKLKKALIKINKDINVIEVLTSVQSAIDYFIKNPEPELLFMDIELSDGLSFKIFEKIKLSCPIIFITAYDEYWQEAFEHNSIDYLLKPFKEDKLETAIKKYESIKKYFAAGFQQLLQYHQSPHSGYKKRFLVKKGSDYVSIRTEDIAYLYAAHKVVCLVDRNGQKFILDQSLSEIEKQLDASFFYRVNRKYLVSQNAIRKIKSWPKSKLFLELDPAIEEDIVISQENAAAFKEWMGQ